jgi:translocation and assembly module TamB
MKRRWTRIICWTAIGVAAISSMLGLVLVSGYAALQSEAGRARLVETLNRQLSTPGGTQVRIGRLEGDLLKRVEIQDLSVSDNQGIWLRLKSAAAIWRPAALLGGKLSISKLDADGLTVLRQPVSAEPSEPIQWPEFPLGLSIDRFTLLDAELAHPVLGEEVKFRASGDTAIEGPNEIRTAFAVTRTDAISGQARLSVLLQPRSKFLRIELALNEAEGGVLARALDLDGLPSVSVQAVGEGPFEDVKGNSSIRAGDLASIESRFRIDATEGPAFEIAGDASIAALVGPRLRELLAGKVVFDLRGAFTDDGVALRRGALANQLAQVELSGALSGVAANVDITVTVNDLVPFARVAGVDVQGQAKIRSRIRSDDIRRVATAATDATFTQLLPPTSPLAALTGPRLTAAGTLKFDTGRDWTVRDLTLSGAAAELNGNGTLSADGTRLAGDFRLNLQELGVFSDAIGKPLAGQAAIAGTIGGSLDNPTVAVDMTSPDMSVDGLLVGATRIRLEVPQTTKAVQGEVDASVDNNRLGAVTLFSRFSAVAGDKLNLDGLTLQARESTLAGSMTIDLATATANGKLASQAFPLAPWSDLAGRTLSGNAGVTLDMSSSGRSQQFDLSVSADGLNVNLESGQLVRIDSVAASARVEDAFGTPSGGMRVLLDNARTSSSRLTSAALEVKMENSRRVSARLQTRGELGAPFELESIADYDADDRGFVVTVSKADVSYADQTIKLTKPARIERADGTTKLSMTTFEMAGGRLMADGQIGVADIRAHLELEQIDLAALDAVVPLADISGTLSGHASVSGARSAPTGELDLNTADLRSAHTTLETAPPIAGRLHGNWRDDRLQLNAIFEEIAETTLDARATVP